jgi:3-isopropylmalate/(R)-2-methylmalate dehydratase small subunit
MEKFKKIVGIAAPFTRMNVDTDLIIPAENLKTVSTKGLGKNLFSYIRFNEDGSENKKFVLNEPHYKNSIILVTGKNFGCGSSREHAVWALKDFGIKCLIGSEFADIFYNNCFKNGILPIILNINKIEKIVKIISSPKTSELEIDLENQSIKTKENKTINFEIFTYLKKNLLDGIDDISKTLEKKKLIDEFEINMEKKYPWLGKKNG